MGNGLLRYDGRYWTKLSSGDGLGGDSIFSVCQDAQGAYWIGTDNGLTRYQPSRITPATPQLSFRTEKQRAQVSSITRVTQGGLVDFKFNAIDFKTLPGAIRYRHQLVRGSSEKLH